VTALPKRQRSPLGGANCMAAQAQSANRQAAGTDAEGQTTLGGRTAEIEGVHKMIRDLKAGAKRLVELT
jgi:hypothetical protein